MSLKAERGLGSMFRPIIKFFRKLQIFLNYAPKRYYKIKLIPQEKVWKKLPWKLICLITHAEKYKLALQAYRKK